MITNIEETLQEMKLIYGWTESTKKSYKTSILHYVQYNKTTLTELITEAEIDEETINKPKKRRIYKRLIKYLVHMQNNFTPNSTINYMAKVCKVYKHYDITIPELPTVRNTIVETYDDLPTSEEISKAILHSRTKMKALITFIASSGLRRSDVSSLTIQDFINATSEYHKSSNIVDVISELKEQELIIPTWHIRTVKNNTNHITFNSHECTGYILQMLTERLMQKEILNDDLLFEVKPDSISKNFRNLNNKLGFGWKQTRRHFHPHSLRKYFATILNAYDVPYLDVQFMIGHSIGNVNSSYYYANSDRLKQKYYHVMEHLQFTVKVAYVDVPLQDRRELEELKKYKSESARKIRQLEEMVNLLCKDDI